MQASLSVKTCASFLSITLLFAVDCTAAIMEPRTKTPVPKVPFICDSPRSLVYIRGLCAPVIAVPFTFALIEGVHKILSLDVVPEVLGWLFRQHS